MGLVFYYASGSPFAWKVWLCLEHKALDYELRLLSFDSGDLNKPDYLAVNPRGRVPAITDDGFALWESGPIVEYLEDRFPERPVLPADPKARATARRIAAESDCYLYPAVRKLLGLTVYRKSDDAEPKDLAAAFEPIARELTRCDHALGAGDWLAGTLSVADYAIYPHLRMLRRLDERLPRHKASKLIGPKLERFMERIEALPYHDKTLPPHWRG